MADAGKAAAANDLVETLRAMSAEMQRQTEISQRLLEENKALRGREEPRATAGRSKRESNPRLMLDLARLIPQYTYSLSEPDAFRHWLTRHEPTFLEDGEDLTERERTRLLLNSLEESTFRHYVDSQRHVEDVNDVSFEDTVDALKKLFAPHRSLMMLRQECLQISRSAQDSQDPLTYTNRIGEMVLNAKLSEMTTDDWSVFLFLRGLDSPSDGPAKQYLMHLHEDRERKGEKVTLSQIHDDWIRWIQLKQQTREVTAPVQHQKVDVLMTDSAKSDDLLKPKKITAGNQEKKNQKRPKCQRCNRSGHHTENCYAKTKLETKEIQNVQVNGVQVSVVNPTIRHLQVPVNGVPVEFQLDTGSAITLVNRKTWKRLGSPKLSPLQCRITCSNGSTLSAIGQMRTKFVLKGAEYSGVAHVRERGTDILGMSWLTRSPEMRKLLDDIVIKANCPEESIRPSENSREINTVVFVEGPSTGSQDEAHERTTSDAKTKLKRAKSDPHGSRRAVDRELKRFQQKEAIEPKTKNQSTWSTKGVAIRKNKNRVSRTKRANEVNVSQKTAKQNFASKNRSRGFTKGVANRQNENMVSRTKRANEVIVSQKTANEHFSSKNRRRRRNSAAEKAKRTSHSQNSKRVQKKMSEAPNDRKTPKKKTSNLKSRGARNVTRKPFQVFQSGEQIVVRVRQGHRWSWQPGIVRGSLDDSNYYVQTECVRRAHVGQMRRHEDVKWHKDAAHGAQGCGNSFMSSSGFLGGGPANAERLAEYRVPTTFDNGEVVCRCQMTGCQCRASVDRGRWLRSELPDNGEKMFDDASLSTTRLPNNHMPMTPAPESVSNVRVHDHQGTVIDSFDPVSNTYPSHSPPSFWIPPLPAWYLHYHFAFVQQTGREDLLNMITAQLAMEAIHMLPGPINDLPLEGDVLCR